MDPVNHLKFNWTPVDLQRLVEEARLSDNPELATLLALALELQEKILFAVARNRDQLRALARAITDYINSVSTAIPFTPDTFAERATLTMEQLYEIRQLYAEYLPYEEALKEIYEQKN